MSSVSFWHCKVTAIFFRLQEKSQILLQLVWTNATSLDKSRKQAKKLSMTMNDTKVPDPIVSLIVLQFTPGHKRVRNFCVLCVKTLSCTKMAKCARMDDLSMDTNGSGTFVSYFISVSWWFLTALHGQRHSLRHCRQHHLRCQCQPESLSLHCQSWYSLVWRHRPSLNRWWQEWFYRCRRYMQRAVFNRSVTEGIFSCKQAWLSTLKCQDLRQTGHVGQIVAARKDISPHMTHATTNHDTRYKLLFR